MPITISCTCGKTLRVKDELAGKRIKCPACNQLMSVPAPRPAPREEPVATLEAVAPEEAKPAPKKKKRAEPFWISTGLLNTLVVINDDALFVADLDNEELEQAKESLEDGEPARKVLRDKGKVVALDDVEKVETDLNTTFLDVTWKSPGSLEATETTVHCPSKEARDEVFAAIKERLGDDWDEEKVEYSKLRAAALPLYTGAILLFLCFCLYMVATGQDKGGGGGGGLLDFQQLIFLILLYVFGATGTLILTALITALVFLWLYYRVKSPPIMLTLAPARAGRRKRRK